MSFIKERPQQYQVQNNPVSIALANSPYTVPANVSEVNVNTAGGNVTVNVPVVARAIKINKVSTDIYIVKTVSTENGEVAGPRSSITYESGYITKDEPWYPWDAYINSVGTVGEDREIIVRDQYGKVMTGGRAVAGVADEAMFHIAMDYAYSPTLTRPRILLGNDLFKFSDALTVDRICSFVGSGNTRILQLTADKHIFSIPYSASPLLHTLEFRNLELGTVAGTGNCFDVVGVHYSIFDNINIHGCGNIGIRLEGCMMNHLNDISVRYHNQVMFHASIASPTTCIQMDENVANNLPCNANVITNPIFEAGANGLIINSRATRNAGNNTVVGGTMESIGTNALSINNARDFHLYGTHIESTVGTGHLSSSNFINCDNVIFKPSYCGPVVVTNCRNFNGENAVWTGLTISADSINTKVKNIILVKNRLFDYSEDAEIDGRTYETGDCEYGYRIERSRAKDIFCNPRLDYWTTSVLPSGLPNGLTPLGATDAQVKCGTGLTDTTKKYTYSINIKKAAVSGYIGVLTNNLPLAAGKYYTVDCWIKPVSGSVVIGQVGMPSGSFVQYFTVSGASGEWQHVVVAFKIPVADTTGYVTVSTPYSASACEFYLGGFKLYVNPEDCPPFGSSTGTGSEQTIAHGLAAIPTGCKAWIKYLVGARYITEMIPFDATNVYPTVTSGLAYEWRIE